MITADDARDLNRRKFTTLETLFQFIKLQAMNGCTIAYAGYPRLTKDEQLELEALGFSVWVDPEIHGHVVGWAENER